MSYCEHSSIVVDNIVQHCSIGKIATRRYVVILIRDNCSFIVGKQKRVMVIAQSTLISHLKGLFSSYHTQLFVLGSSDLMSTSTATSICLQLCYSLLRLFSSYAFFTRAYMHVKL